jgi:AAA domain-containing protein
MLFLSQQRSETRRGVKAARLATLTPGRREPEARPDALVILDEAPTTSMPDLAAIVRHAARSGAKVVITGGHAQLGAALMARDAIDVRGNLQVTG